MKDADNTPERPDEAQTLPQVTDIKLTSDEVSEIVDFINRKARSPTDACPVCGSPDNIVIDDVYRVSVQTEPTSIGGRYQPLISTVCHNCGFVRFFNQNIVLAVMEEEKRTTSEPADESGNGG